MRRIVLGTAGHIDHGKTSLVKALTGVDTDRLKEEKARGITIELGFTHLKLPDGTELGFVDVPGHEKFVRTMIAGATGIDVVLLVIAADEGVMPQTREHLDICSLLGVQDGILVLNKIDAVDAEMAELAEEDAKSAVAGTFLEGRPIVRFSAKTGEGKDALLAAITVAAAAVNERGTRGPFRIAVDRVFTMKGFGTVITGTAAGGRVRPGDSLEVHPGGAAARVRGVQVHGRDAEEALAGSRTAINLQGIEKEQVPRGAVLATAGSLVPSHILDVEYRHLRTAPDAFRARRVRFLSGTQEVVGNLKLLDGEKPRPGGTHLAQLRLETPIALRAGDRYVLRTWSPMVTVGGGRVLDPHARKRTRADAGALAHLQALAGADGAARALALIADAGPVGLANAELARRLPPGESDDATSTLKSLVRTSAVEALDGALARSVSREAFDRTSAAALAILAAFHKASPSLPGMPRGVLAAEALRRVKAGGPEALATADAVLRKLESAKKIAAAGGDLKLPGHVPTIDAASSDLKPAIEKAYLDAGLTPPTVKEASEPHAARAKEVASVIALLMREGVLVKVTQDLYFHRDPIGTVTEKLIAHLRANPNINAIQFKELAGNVSRKFAIPLLEHFDAIKLTMRIGDERVLRKKP